MIRIMLVNNRLKLMSIAGTIILLIPLLSACTGKPTQPNVLLILTDDQAYGDLSLTGNPWLETPHLDTLAQEGVWFQNFYVSPVCAPTRASLLTGRYHQRTGVSGVTRGRENMNLSEQTMADMFKQNGYVTGCFGKWHNGAHFPYHPLGRGFDEFLGFTAGHWTNYFNSTLDHNGAEVSFTGYLPDVLTDSAGQFMIRAAQQDKPFFCYVPFNTPHTPAQVPDRFFDKYKQKGLDDFNAAIYGMCENIDGNVGRLLQTLDSLGLSRRTIVVFFSDYGPLNLRFNAGLKGRKGSVDEGGVKVPCFIRWDSHLPAGKKVEAITAHIDLLPTLKALAGLDFNFTNEIDGRDMTPLISDPSFSVHDALFQEWSGHRRVRTSDYLMVDSLLYHLPSDPGQSRDVSDSLPAVFSRLNRAFDRWWTDVSKNVNNDARPIPVGYDEYPVTTLPAHEAELFPPFPQRQDRRHTGIAYYALYGWAHDWIDHWTDTAAWCAWPLKVVDTDVYHVYFKYNCAEENAGCRLKCSFGDQSLVTTIEKPFYELPLPSPDRQKRDQEAPERNWALHYAGEIELKKGEGPFEVQTILMPGTESIELKAVRLVKNGFAP